MLPGPDAQGKLRIPAVGVDPQDEKYIPARNIEYTTFETEVRTATGDMRPQTADDIDEENAKHLAFFRSLTAEQLAEVPADKREREWRT